MFRFNHPKEAARLREKRKVGAPGRGGRRRTGRGGRRRTGRGGAGVRGGGGMFCTFGRAVMDGSVSPQSGLLSSLSLSMTDLSRSCENLSTVMLYNPG